MSAPIEMVEIWRGAFRECVHLGQAVVAHADSGVVKAWGDPAAVVLPRSSAKMLQALPLIESGAAAAFGLTDAQLAFSCASHSGGGIHVNAAQSWLTELGMADDDLRCGPQEPSERAEMERLIRARENPCQMHNNCSGKHAGFLTLGKHLGAGPDYIDPDHPVQKAVLSAFEEVTAETTAGFAIDGCSAPNFACSLEGMARAMAFFAGAREGQGTRQDAAVRLRNAMMQFPELVAGEGRACTRLMRAMNGRAAIKTGAEGYFIAIIPEKKLGVALKISDGATRASEIAIAALLVHLGVLDANHPEAQAYLRAPIKSRLGLAAGEMRPAPSFV